MKSNKFLFKKNDIVVYEHDIGIIDEAYFMTGTDLKRYDVIHDGIRTSGVLEYEIYSPRKVHYEKGYSNSAICGDTKQPEYMTRNKKYIKCKKCMQKIKELDNDTKTKI